MLFDWRFAPKISYTTTMATIKMKTDSSILPASLNQYFQIHTYLEDPSKPRSGTPLQLHLRAIIPQPLSIINAQRDNKKTESGHVIERR